MKAFVVLATVLAAASANPQLLLNNQLLGVHGLGVHGLGLHGAALTYSAAPLATQVISAPAVTYAVPTATKTQYHAQDELGQASHGYAYAGQSAQEVRDAAGNVRGSYAYINPEGKEVRAEYTAGHGGFQVASNALPIAPVHNPIQPVANLVQPAPVQETPEVIQARAAHAVAHQQALARSGRKKRGVVTSVIPSTLGYSSVLGHPVSALGYSTLGYSTLGYSNVISHPLAQQVVASPLAQQVVASPLAYSSIASPVSVVAAAQPVREATLTKIANNPGHAISYRVD